MPLPSLLPPSSLPAFLVEGHAATWQAPFSEIPMGTGHRRKRRVSTTKPQIVDVSLILEPAQMTAFHLWFRDSLRSGERHFAARVKEQGVGMLWYEAVWLEMYRSTALAYGRWLVEGQLILRGDGQAEAPTTGAFEAEVVIALGGSGSLTVEKNFEAEISIALFASTRFESEVTIALEAEETGS